jgi:hypothetical protein
MIPLRPKICQERCDRYGDDLTGGGFFSNLSEAELMQ